jgi:hypothetical protein
VSIHPNPDGSETEGVKIEPNAQFIAHAFVASLTSATALTGVAAAKAAGANQAIVQAQTAAVFYRLDGTAPTASVGVQIPAGSSVALNMTDAANALFISATGSLAVSFTM